MDYALFKIAKFYSATDLYKSAIPEFRYTIIYNDKLIHFGIENEEAFIDNFNHKERRNWYNHHYKLLNKDGKRMIHVKDSPGFWTARILYPILPENHFLGLSLEQKKNRFINIVDKIY